MASYDDLDNLLSDLIRAAIDADMWKRGYNVHEGNRYYSMASWREVYEGEPERNDMAGGEDDTDYEAEVFQFWPQAINEIFAAWRPDVLPDPARFQQEIDWLYDLGPRSACRPGSSQPLRYVRQGHPAQASGGRGLPNWQALSRPT